MEWIRLTAASARVAKLDRNGTGTKANAAKLVTRQPTVAAPATLEHVRDGLRAIKKARDRDQPRQN